MSSRLVGLDDPDEWDQIVRRCDFFDVYHLAAYQHVPTPMDTGTAVLAVVEDNASGSVAALPLRLRRVNEVDAIRKSGEFSDDLLDAVSPYGYPGMIAQTSTLHLPHSTLHPPPSTLHLSLDALLREHNIVSAFIRQHPLFDSASLFEKPFSVERAGNTVAIDLTMDEQDYIRQTRSSHRREVAGWNARQPTFEEPGHASLRTFAETYRASMRRKGAHERYLFDDAYFDNLGRHLGAHPGVSCRVFAARVADSPSARFDTMAIVLTCGSIAQYHLGVTPDNKSASGLSRWLLDQIRLTLKQEGFATLHLGGGLGAADDSLLRFKSGFSEWRPPFRVVKWIGDPTMYHRLCEVVGAAADASYFPAYRA